MGKHIKTFETEEEYFLNRDTFTDKHVAFIRELYYVDFGDYDNSNLNEFGLEGDLIITAESNPPVFAALNDAGIHYDTTAGGYTIADLAAITDNDIAPQEEGEATADPIFYNKPIVNFNEFKYFTGIDGSCFYDLPNDDYGLFSGTNLKKITIPKNVNCSEHKIYGAFITCSLDYVSVDGENQTYDSRGNCNAIIKTSTNQLIKASSSTVIPNTVTELFSRSFSDLTINSITIPSSVTSIGASAFSGCTSLQSITIPSSVTSIGMGAFGRCTSLQNITIPSSVTSIETSAFVNCTSLQNITIPNSVTNLGTANLFSSCSSLQSVSIPNSVTNIGNNMFINCVSLQNITIPSSVTSIGSQAFYGCTSLPSIMIPSSVTTIGTYAFYNCSSLNSITIPSSVTSIGTAAFYNCSSLNSITCEGTTVPSIQSNTFQNVARNGVLTVPTAKEVSYGMSWLRNNVAYYLGYYGWRVNDVVVSLYNNSALYSILTENGFTESSSLGYRISDLAALDDNDLISEDDNSTDTSSDDMAISIFYNASNLTSFEEFQYFTGVTPTILQKGTTYYDGKRTHSVGFFAGTKIKKIILPPHLTHIGVLCFNDVPLESIKLSQSLVEIGIDSFAGTNLTRIELPSSVTKICQSGLCCPSLTEIVCSSTTPPTLGKEMSAANPKFNAFGTDYPNSRHIAENGTLYYPEGADYSSWLSNEEFCLGYFGWTGEEI